MALQSDTVHMNMPRQQYEDLLAAISRDNTRNSFVRNNSDELDNALEYLDASDDSKLQYAAFIIRCITHI